MAKSSAMVRVLCPECDAGVHVSSNVELYETVTCSECGTVLEVINVNPIELDYAEDDYDYDDDDYDDYDDDDYIDEDDDSF